MSKEGAQQRKEDWAAMAQAVRARASELGLTQVQLAARSEVSLAIIQEIWADKFRKRNPRTLAALSQALALPPQHLSEVAGMTSPVVGDADQATREGAESVAVEELARRVGEVQSEVRDILDRVGPGLAEKDLTSEIAELRGLVEQLYTRLGHPLPDSAASDTDSRRRTGT